MGERRKTGEYKGDTKRKREREREKEMRHTVCVCEREKEREVQGKVKRGGERTLRDRLSELKFVDMDHVRW